MLSEILFYILYSISTFAVVYDTVFNKTGKYFFIRRYDLTVPYILSSTLLVLRVLRLVDYPYLILLVVIIPAVVPIMVGMRILAIFARYRLRQRGVPERIVIKVDGKLFAAIPLMYALVSLLSLELISVEDVIEYFSVKPSVLIYLPVPLALLVILTIANYKVIKHFHAFEIKTPRRASSTMDLNSIQSVIVLPILEEFIYRLVFYDIFGFTIQGITLSAISSLAAHAYKFHFRKLSLWIVRLLFIATQIVLSIANFVLLHNSKSIVPPILVHIIYNAIVFARGL